MIRDVILDAGPLVAFMNDRDRDHRWAREQWDRIESPLLTCEAVVVEACFLARRLGRGGEEGVVSLIRRGVIEPSFRLVDHAEAVLRLMSKYRDVPMSLADACLVRMSELHRDSPVLTLDRGFAIYRRKRRQPIPLLSPGIRGDIIAPIDVEWEAEANPDRVLNP